MSGWTVDTLHVHMQRQIDDFRAMLNERHMAQQVAMRAALEAAEKAVGKAEVAAEKRFDGQNEFRQQLGDQASTFISRVEHEATVLRLSERIQELSDRANRQEGKGAGVNASWGYLVAAVGLIATVIAVIIAVGAL